MNEKHKTNRLKNRLNRCKKRLSDKDLPSEQRTKVQQRLAELELLFIQPKQFGVLDNCYLYINQKG